jgi:serine/threonine protein kinase
VPERFGDDDEYTRGEFLGKGAFATVFACKKAGSHTPLAAKTFDLRMVLTAANAAREVKRLQREASILKEVPAHPNIVSFVDIAHRGKEWLFLVMELVDGGHLLNAMVERPTRRLVEEEALYVFRQLVTGLGWLHDNGVIHRDLKLENVLVARSRKDGANLLLNVKITDFGLSRFFGPGCSTALSTVGSPRYMAPEVKAKGAHDNRVDLWSLGILLSVLLGGRFPCDGLPNVRQDKLDNAVESLPVGVHAKSVVYGLLQKRPEERLTIADLKIHPWLKTKSLPSSSADGNGMAVAGPLKRRRLSRKSSVDDSPWTREDNERVSSMVAELTSVMQEPTLPQRSLGNSRGGGRGKPSAKATVGKAAPVGRVKPRMSLKGRVRGRGRGRKGDRTKITTT